MIFLEFWFKIYKEATLIFDEKLEEILVESLYLAKNSKYKGPWVSLPLKRLIAGLEDLQI